MNHDNSRNRSGKACSGILQSLVYSDRCSGCTHLHWFRVCMEYFQPSDSVALSRSAVVVQSAIYDVYNGARPSRLERRLWRTMGRAPWTARGSDGISVVFWNRPHYRWNGLGTETIDPGVFWHGNRWWDRLWARLHCSGQHVGQVVPGSPWYGNGNGNNGVWRRRVHRLDLECFLYSSNRSSENRHRLGYCLPRRDACRRRDSSTAAQWMEAERLDCSGGNASLDHQSQRL